MTNNSVINEYIKNLSRHLGALSTSERDSIAEEIRTHLEARAAEERLEEAVAGLGAPKLCAQAYLEELSILEEADDKGADNSARSLPIKVWGRVSAISGFALMGFLYLLAISFVLSLLAELVQPSHSGLWLEAGHLHWGTTSGIKYDIEREILGLWYVPLNIILVAVFFMLAETVGRFSKRRVLHDW